jgi:hypothetical protein
MDPPIASTATPTAESPALGLSLAEAEALSRIVRAPHAWLEVDGDGGAKLALGDRADFANWRNLSLDFGGVPVRVDRRKGKRKGKAKGASMRHPIRA